VVLALSAAACAPAPPPPPPTDVPGRVTVQMDAGWSSGFFSLPWPNAIRKKADGTLDLAGLPTGGNLVLDSLLRTASGEISDFGTNAAIYLRTTGRIDPSTLPTPSQTLDPASPIQVVALDGSDARVPVVVRVEPADRFRGSNVVSLLPYPGHRLRSDTDYAVVVTSGVTDLTGAPLAPAPLIERLDRPFASGFARSSAHWSALRTQRDAARGVLDRTGVWDAADLVGFTALRTQDSQALLTAVDAAVDAFAVQVPALSTNDTCADGRLVLTGQLRVPRFQVGNTPSTFGGGRIEVRNGAAVVQAVDEIGVGVNVPCGESPASGWAIQTYLDGTGAVVVPNGGFGRAATRTVIGSIAPLYSPEENGSQYNELLFYNFLNPPAARTNPIQQTADNLVLIRMLQLLDAGDLPADVVPVGFTIDDDRVVVTGHSQGAQTVALVASMAPEVRAIASSAASSGQYNSISYRSDVRAIVGQVLGSSAGIDIRNPMVQAIQTLMDVSEPSNYPTTGHWLNFAGRDDGCLVLEASRHLARAQGLAVVEPQWGSIFGDAALDPVTATAPVSANGPGATTRVSIEAPGRHQVASGNLALTGAFIDQIAQGATPVVPGGPYGVGPPDTCAPRYGTIGNHN
jgi:hypothetical protein